MTEMTIRKQNGRPIGFHCAGHSGYAAAGQDIVCAAISALTQFVIGYGEKYHLPIQVTMDESSGVMECNLLRRDEEFEKVLAAFEDAVGDIQKSYSAYFSLKFTEV